MRFLHLLTGAGVSPVETQVPTSEVESVYFLYTKLFLTSLILQV